MFSRLTNRRELMATVAGFAAAAAINPFPDIVPAMAQDASPTPNLPEKADSQVLRWIGPGTTRLAQFVYDSFWARMSQNVYMTPFVQQKDGSITPGICSDYTVSDDLLTYTFTMNPDSVWSDGTKVTSHDIKYSWEWMANITVSENIYNYYQTQSVVGNPDVVAGTATEMSGLVALDDNTLQITLSEPYTPFIYYCTHCLMGVHQKANIEQGGPDWDKSPTVASGPFKVERFDINTGGLVLVQNEHWWGTKPQIERIELNPISDGGTASLAWTNDECEVWASGGTSDFYRQFGVSEVITRPGPTAAFFRLNTSVAPLDDEHLRRALQRASDINTVTSVVWGDYVAPVSLFFEPGGLPADKKNYLFPATGISFPTDPAYKERQPLFDIDAAKAELAQSKYANGEVPSVLFVVASGDYVKAATVLQQMWQDALGVKSEVVPADQATAEQNAAAAITVGANNVLYDGPGGLLSWGWHKDNYHMEAVHAADDDIESLLNQGDSIPFDQVTDRAAAYAQAEDLILERGYAIPWWWGGFPMCVKSRIVNASMNSSSIFDVTTTYIAKQ